MNIRPIAIYLPQYHPVPENDEWWGRGFTEWTNVTKAQPLFKGHYQPHLPADLGFYDLRLSEVREAQAKLAAEHSIYGFCYYHYWFNGRRILERPFQEVFESGKPDFPFMLCWANENWTRIWDGSDREILLEQKYSEEDDKKHIQSLIPYFKDERYIKVDGKPVFSIYRSTKLPDVENTLRVWREEAAKHGLELYICRFESFSVAGNEYLEDGFDAAIDFQPWGREMNLYKYALLQKEQKKLSFRIRYFLYRRLIDRFKTSASINFRKKIKDDFFTINQFNYEDYVNFILNCPLADYKQYPGITPMWDNTARRKINPSFLCNSTPGVYKKWLNNCIDKFQPFSKDENFIFINAWNEWAEGNHLEPCIKWDRAYLEATKQAFCRITK